MTTTLTPNVGALKQRDTLRLCTAGSVDDGKSTFVGRLLYDTKSVLADQVESMERTSTDRGFDGMDLSLLVDGLRAEREQGITIDVAYRYFATDKRTFILAEISVSTLSERGATRADDKLSESAMEDRKKEGYF